jgi:aldehyde dehydrogenase (NAD+)
MIYSYKLFIDNEWVESASGECFEVLDPATEEVLGVVPRGNKKDIDHAVEVAHRAFSAWRNTPPAARGALLYRYAAVIKANADRLAEVECLNCGKPISSARGDVAEVVRFFEYYAGAADKIQGDTIPMGPGYLNYTIPEPLGVTAHVVPWNFPLSLFARSVAPALAAGNTVVVKPAEQTPLTTLMIAELSKEAGFPPGVINVVAGFGDEAGAPLVGHPNIRGVAFTGSVETGQAIIRQAAENLIPVVPELGGKSPNIIFADADLDRAVVNAHIAMFSNAGQVCSAGTRLIVQNDIRQQFLERLAERVKTIRLGPGMDDPDMGPLISAPQLRQVMNYMEVGQSEGAVLITGGGRPAALPKGYFVEPTIFDQVEPQMTIAQEEIFGPVLSVFSFDDEEEAVEIANNSKYGLVAGVFTNNLSRAFRLASRIEAGKVYINEYFAGDVSAPFGGYKHSGFGRLQGMDALNHFTQVKDVSVCYNTELED